MESPRYTLVSDFHGRSYRLGESAPDLIGRSRSWMVRLPWIAMAAASLLQYGVAALLPVLARAHGWTRAEALCVLGVWVGCQAGVAAPGIRLYRRSGGTGSRLAAGPAVLLGVAGVCCAVALGTLSVTGDLRAVLLGYSVLGGVGAGLVYVVCIGVAAEWFPERIASVTGTVSGAFGYGAVPFVLVAAVVSGPAPGVTGAAGVATLLGAAAVLAGGAVAGVGLLVRRPPAHWWPAQIDPRLWALDRRLNRSIPANAPAIRTFSTGEALRSGVLPLMWVVVGVISAMALFDLGYLATTGDDVALPIGVLALATGVGRVVTGRLSDRLGRRRMLVAALLLSGLGQFCLLVAVDRGLAVPIAAAIAGAGTGAGYSLLVGLVRDWFGDQATLPNYGVVYTGKAVGGVAGLLLVGASPGGPGAFAVAGCLGLAGALLAAALRRPGLPPVLLPGA